MRTAALIDQSNFESKSMDCHRQSMLVLLNIRGQKSEVGMGKVEKSKAHRAWRIAYRQKTAVRCQRTEDRMRKSNAEFGKKMKSAVSTNFER